MQHFENIRSPIHNLTWSPDGQTLLATYRKGMKIGWLDLAQGTFRRWHPYIDHPAQTVAYSPCGKYLAVGSAAGLVLPYLLEDENYDTEFHVGEPFGRKVPVNALGWAPKQIAAPVQATASLGLELW